MAEAGFRLITTVLVIVFIIFFTHFRRSQWRHHAYGGIMVIMHLTVALFPQHIILAVSVSVILLEINMQLMWCYD